MTIILTGASSGIGAALTRALAADGHTLYVCARRLDRLDAVTGHNTLACGFACDVSVELQVRHFIARVAARTTTLDALINCAGAFGYIGPVAPLSTTSATAITDTHAWFDTLRTNLFGPYLMTRYALPLLLRAPHPAIINFAGGGAFSPLPNYSAYACSKAALVRLTECLAAELATSTPPVAVNAVAPGMVATAIHEATLAAGPARAGRQQYAHAYAVLHGDPTVGTAPMSVAVACVRALLSPALRGLTGKTISANHDPWDSADFPQRLPEIVQSDLYTLRRVNDVEGRR